MLNRASVFTGIRFVVGNHIKEIISQMKHSVFRPADKAFLLLNGLAGILFLAEIPLGMWAFHHIEVSLWLHIAQALAWLFDGALCINAAFLWGKRTFKRILSVVMPFRRNQETALPWEKLVLYAVLQALIFSVYIPIQFH